MSDPVKGPNCGVCKYFVESGYGIGSGRCHRRAPAMEVRGAVWPNVWIDYWCGEFERRPGTNLTAAEVDENFAALEQR